MLKLTSGKAAMESMIAKILLVLCSVLLAFIFSSSMPSLATTPPTITPVNSYYVGQDNPSVTMTAAAGTIYFTTDGSVPSSSSTVYGAPFQITSSMQVNAIAINAGVSSTITSAFYINDSHLNNLATPNAWYSNSFGPAATGKIAEWADTSGNSANAVQATSADQPSIVSNSINGIDAISFNGTATCLQPPSLTFGGTGATIYAVVNATTPTASAQILNYSGATAPDNLIELSESTSKAAQFTVYNSAGASPTSVAAPTALPTNLYSLIEVVQGDINSTTATMFVNGAQVAQNSAMNPIPNAILSNNYIGKYSGGSEYFKGNIAELMVYTTPLTATQRALIEAYLMGKYQIAMQTPTAPVFSNTTSTLTAPIAVAIAAQPSAKIFYTTNNTTPTSSSSSYSGPVRINYTQTLKAIAISNGISSAVTSATYTLNSTQFPAPATGGPSLQINVSAPAMGIP
jgi:hypothetical protein